MLNGFIDKLKKEHNQTQLPFLQLRKMGLIYNTYRVIISLFLFLSSYALTFNKMTVASTLNLPSFLQQITLLFYCFFSLLLLTLYYFIPRQIVRQLGIGLTFDVIIISLLLYTTGAPDIQLIMLYLVVVSASFIILPPYQSVIITLMAIIFVIYQNFLYAITNTMGLPDIGDALLISLTFVAVGYLSWFVSQRLARIEKIANEQATEVAKLNIINRQVISNMTHGVMVFNKDLILQLTNRSTLTLLNLNLPKDIVRKLNNDKYSAFVFMQQINLQHPKLLEWLTKVTRKTQATFNYELSQSTLKTSQLRFTTTPLEEGSLLVIIEDIHREQTNAQQLKLASLGQLTASIAHEIRNPLAAISQASQLLIEDAETLNEHKENINFDANIDRKLATHMLDESDIELYRMIYNQTKRVNQIIEDVLKLSKQDKPDQITFMLSNWLEEFVQDNFDSKDVVITTSCDQKVNFDKRQLEQILVNLINNGLRFSRKIDSSAHIKIETDYNYNDVIIDIIDSGEGVAESDQLDLFNPFFTTDSDGTGLGLYLSQSFALANNSRLVYVQDHPDTCFRLLIPRVIEDE